MGLRRPEKEIEILREVQVLVVGGGPAGLGAAVAAARQGMKTLLLEKGASSVVILQPVMWRTVIIF